MYNIDQLYLCDAAGSTYNVQYGIILLIWQKASTPSYFFMRHFIPWSDGTNSWRKFHGDLSIVKVWLDFLREYILRQLIIPHN